MATSASPVNVLQAMSDGLADMVERIGRSVVGVHAGRRFPASGIFWQSGVVVTTAHTLTRDEGITVLLPDGNQVPAGLKGRDPGTDIAVLTVEGLECPTLERGEADTLKVGHVVFALAGRDSAFTRLDYGLVAGVGPAWRTWRGAEIDRFVCLDGGLRPGFSGAPLIDASGQVMGLCTSALARGAGILIPMATLNRIVGDLLSSGRVSRGYLGVGLQPAELPAAWVSELQLSSGQGLLVASVESGGPGEKAGLSVGDILVTLEGKPCSRMEDVLRILSSASAGRNVSIELIRGRRRVEITLTLGERPQRRRCA